jgi:hypothetical protein
MAISFGPQIEKMPISKLIVEKDRWQKNASEKRFEGDVEYCNKVIAKIDANIERKSKLSVLGQILDTDHANVYDETEKCRVLYPVASDVRKDCTSVYIIGSDGRVDSMKTMHVSKVEQYVTDHGFDPNGSWT